MAGHDRKRLIATTEEQPVRVRLRAWPARVHQSWFRLVNYEGPAAIFHRRADGSTATPLSCAALPTGLNADGDVLPLNAELLPVGRRVFRRS